MRGVRLWGGLLFLVLGALGYGLSYCQDARHRPQHISHYSDSLSTYAAIITAPLQRKAKSMQAILAVQAVRRDSSWLPCTGNVLVYFQLDTASIRLNYGDELILETHLQPIAAASNPAAFDMAAYYQRQGIYQQSYLPRRNWWRTGWKGQLWRQTLYDWRAYLLTILKQHLDTPNEFAVASALLLGAKEHLDSNLRNAYADTGAMHVLAVSGLHVGILILILSHLLVFLKQLGPLGKQLQALLLLLALWLFAFLTGASASVLRASTMFSFVLFGRVLGRPINVYNSLAASAFLLLLTDTHLLYNVGFQLSYLALWGIVFLQPKIYRWWTFKTRWVDWLWQGTSVALAAQLATAPLSLYYFHQFPIFFWLSSLVVTAAAGVLLGLGIALLLLSKVPLLGGVLGQVFQWALFIMNSVIFGIQQLPGAVWEGFWLELWQLYLAYFILLAVVVCWLQRRLPWGIAALSGLLLYSCFEVWQEGQQLQQNQLCIYHSRKSSAWTLLRGQQSITWSDSSLLHAPALDYLQKNYLCSKGIHTQQQFALKSQWKTPYGQYKNGKGIFGTTALALYGPEQATQRSAYPLPVDYVLLHNNPRLYDVQRIRALYDYDTLVFDGSNSRWQRARWTAACDSLDIPYVDIVESGALVVDLNAPKKVRK
jgi:competence protein ComEC